MHEYQKRSNSSPNLAALQAYRRKIAAQQASSNGGGQEEQPLPKMNRELMYKAYQARLLQLFPSQQQVQQESDCASPASTADVAQTALDESNLHGMMSKELMQAAGQQTDAEATLTQADAETEEMGQEVQAKGDWQEKADTNTVGSESIQLKCASCGVSDSVQVPESELQQHGNGSATEVQLAAKGEKSSESQIQQVAATGFSGSSTSLPHLNQIQQSFGVNLSGVQAYIGGGAAAACQQMGAAAYASGNRIAFKEQPSLELAAHEAAHVVQQASGKVQLAGGVGQVGDEYENHADAVAAKVAMGESAVPLLAGYAKPNQTTGKAELDRAIQDKSQSELIALRGLPALPSFIPQSVLRRVGTRLSQKVLWKRFWQVVIKRFGIRGAAAVALSAADGPIPVGELISLGILIWTLWDLFRLWDELWNQVSTEPQEEQSAASPALKPRPVREPPSEPKESQPEREGENQRTRPPSKNENGCAQKYPGFRLCDVLRDKILQRYQHYNRDYKYLAVAGRGPFGQYIYGSEDAALTVIKAVNGYPEPNPFYKAASDESEIGECPNEGVHLAIRDKRRDNRGDNSYVASILSCPCCEQPGSKISLYALGPHDTMFPPRRRADLSTPAGEQVAITNREIYSDSKF